MNFFTNHSNLRKTDFIGKNKFISNNSNCFLLSRKSVSGSIAVGLFCGLLPAPFQMLTAATIACFFKLNLPIAVFTTLYTNPVTVIPIYILCLKVGLIFLNNVSNYNLFSVFQTDLTYKSSIKNAIEGIPEFYFNEPVKFLTELLHWIMSIGSPLIIGTLIVASLLSIMGYMSVNIIWIVNRKIKIF